jgi:hypothetical protein
MVASSSFARRTTVVYPLSNRRKSSIVPALLDCGWVAGLLLVCGDGGREGSAPRQPQITTVNAAMAHKLAPTTLLARSPFIFMMPMAL